MADEHFIDTEAFIQGVSETHSLEKRRDRRSMRLAVTVGAVCVLVVLAPILILLYQQGRETHELAMVTCETLAIHHRTENEDKHFALATNQSTLMEAIEDLSGALGADITRRRYLVIEPRITIVPPEFCREAGARMPSPESSSHKEGR